MWKKEKFQMRELRDLWDGDDFENLYVIKLLRDEVLLNEF